jgi:hypothetical protein
MSDPRFDNNMRGALFKNNKDGIETRADYRGECEINKVAFYIDAWINQDKHGYKYLSLRFKSKTVVDRDAPRSPPPIKPPAPAAKAPPPDFDDGIPF